MIEKVSGAISPPAEGRPGSMPQATLSTLPVKMRPGTASNRMPAASPGFTFASWFSRISAVIQAPWASMKVKANVPAPIFARP